MSSSRISGTSAASCASLTSTRRDRALVGGRHVAIGLEDARHARARDQHRRPASRSSGGSASALSSMTSTAVPPRPNTTTGPKVGSSARPAISSRAFGRRTIGCTVTPAIARVGLQPLGALEDVGAALRTASSLVRSSSTPPMSDLWTMSGDRILTATVPPSAKIGRGRGRGLLRRLGEGRRARPGCRRRASRPFASSGSSHVPPSRSAPATIAARGRDIGREISRQAVRRLHRVSPAPRGSARDA